jgi:hypothetical protein
VYARAVRGEVHLDPGQRIGAVDFSLPGHGSIAVRVVDPELDPAEGVTVFARSADGLVIDPVSAAATGATGRATLTGLAAGQYTLLARGRGWSSFESEPVRVAEGAEASAEIRLQPGTMLRVAIRDRAGRPAKGWIRVCDSQEREVGGMFAMADLSAFFYQGVFSPTDPGAGPLPPGTYRIEAQAFGELSGTGKLTLSGEGERATTVRVE